MDRIQQAKQALDYVDRIATSGNCMGGTGNVLSLNFDTSAWLTYTDPAIRTANFLAKILATGNNTLKDLPEPMMYNFVRNNVHGNTLIFGSAIALESDVLSHSKRLTFCPYANKIGQGSVTSFDLALSYDYTANGTEWYEEVKARNFSSVEVVNDTVTMDPTVGTLVLRTPVANNTDGRWTFPYYDCGGGNIWMVTYSAPVLGLDSGDVPVFKGVATIDLELTNIDINQCDAEKNDEAGSLDVFRGTHNCQPTTKCVPLKNQGFTRGSYNCECHDGYYFPDTKATLRAYRGADIDDFFSSLSVSSAHHNRFRCLRCQRGCDTCVDATPCLYEYSLAVRLLVVIIVVLLIVGCLGLSVATFKYRKEKVMKTASPMFLQIMIYGAVLMCTSVFLMYPEPSGLLCTLFNWPFHLGFSLLYGSLIIKTWRISVIFKSRKKVNLPDKVLLQRLLPLPAVMAMYLTCWSIVGTPDVIMVTMADTKKFFSCPFNYWNYAVYGVEVLMLLFGVYLCFTVRKAPAHFNESKHITWSTYNGIILGIFIITLTNFLSTTSGPDVVYILLMCQLQVFVTIALCLIFVPKLWALYVGTALDEGGGAAMSTRVGPATTTWITIKQSVHTQVTHEDLLEFTLSSFNTSSQTWDSEKVIIKEKEGGGLGAAEGPQ
ncbi:probable G-protein coupled receptor CG31760 [Littorina saxatilis]|uniref:probable G-protein coupled receptor CG31760 n=1 Tax=Littorina saxatilis TaxID=31220 RepID=UPI0038B435F6